MRHAVLAVAFLTVTAVGVAFHRPASGDAAASRATPEPDVARSMLEKADALAKADPKRAAAFYRACLALEGAAGDAALFDDARTKLKAVEARLVPKPTPRKGVVTMLAAKAEPAPEAVPARPVSVSPDGVVYEAAR